jgi:hypothetical protein
LGKLSVWALRQHSDASRRTHETVKRLRVSSDLTRKILGRSRNCINEVRNSELRQTGDGARNVRTIQELKHPDMGRRGLRLCSHCLSFKVLDFELVGGESIPRTMFRNSTSFV